MCRMLVGVLQPHSQIASLHGQRVQTALLTALGCRAAPCRAVAEGAGERRGRRGPAGPQRRQQQKQQPRRWEDEPKPAVAEQQREGRDDLDM